MLLLLGEALADLVLTPVRLAAFLARRRRLGREVQEALELGRREAGADAGMEKG